MRSRYFGLSGQCAGRRTRRSAAVVGTGVTGEIMHVDAGYHTVGMMAVDEAKALADLMNNFHAAQNPVG